ncbi:MAG: hypothetical protein HOL66_00280 [Rhodospirillaceae bacterium]|jgi:hypothetical protein|nr:hypothetical protein [Rhodospirillaceae bacterium]MBT5242659.1 hypothetical protein [Rhodospirillaceae bacterium]MBT5562822.1 hypothetical protein [Rhodospirillaceae bacterium]MBT6241251.1 hypothetical protein [Rhodospirillaceae bacterium]MBT7137110.1 hypothetical protein [Rhodospirillaceae bacterium]
MIDYLDYFLDGANKGQTVLSALFILLLLSALGAVLGGRRRILEADIFVGWGLLTVIFTLAAVFLSNPLGVLSWCFFAAGIACLIYVLQSQQPLLPPGSIRILIVLSPLLMITAAMEPSQWDEFSHWLSAPKSLFLSLDVPSDDNPPQGTAMLSAYPYGWPYLIYLGSRAAGIFLDGVGRIYNVVFLALFGLLALKIALRAAHDQEPGQLNWKMTGLAAFFILGMNPTFIQKIILTAYADTGTAVAVGISAYLLWMLLDAEAKGDREKATRTAWQAAFVAAALINIKQVNLILFLGLLISFLIAAWRDPEIRLSRCLYLVIGISVLPLFTYFVWRYHVGFNITTAIGGEAHFNPFEQWRFALIPQIILQMLVVATKKAAFFIVMTIAVVLAIRAFFRPSGHYGRLAIIGGGAFVSYNVFLLFTYVASFGERQALTAVSYWRYNTHLGMIATLLIAAWAGLLWKRWGLGTRVPEKVKWLPLLLVVAAPFLFAHKLRFDLEPNKPHYTAIAREIAATIPNEVPLVIVDPMGSGESVVITRYITGRISIPYLSAFHNTGMKNILARLNYFGDKTQTIIHSVTPEMTNKLGDQFVDRKTYLVHWKDGKLQIIKEWPYPK